MHIITVSCVSRNSILRLERENLKISKPDSFTTIPLTARHYKRTRTHTHTHTHKIHTHKHSKYASSILRKTHHSFCPSSSPNTHKPFLQKDHFKRARSIGGVLKESRKPIDELIVPCMAQRKSALIALFFLYFLSLPTSRGRLSCRETRFVPFIVPLSRSFSRHTSDSTADRCAEKTKYKLGDTNSPSERDIDPLKEIVHPPPQQPQSGLR